MPTRASHHRPGPEPVKARAPVEALVLAAALDTGAAVAEVGDVWVPGVGGGFDGGGAVVLVFQVKGTVIPGSVALLSP